MPHVEANGLRFHVQQVRRPGSGHAPRPAVVMVHGLVVDNLSSYYCTLAHPVALVADTYLYDLRGHGLSQVPATGYRVADHVDDLEALLDAWGLTDPVHVVASSYGGGVALGLAHRRPERVASLVLVEAHVPTEGWGEHMAANLTQVASAVDVSAGPDRREWLAHQATRTFGLEETGVREWLARHATRRIDRLVRDVERLLQTTLIDDLRREPPLPAAALAAVGCPTLALYGERSDILDHARALARHVPGCELHLLPGCAHTVLYEATGVVRAHVLDWLARHAVAEPEASGSPARQPDPAGA